MAETFLEPTTRDEVLANIRKARAELEASFAGLSEQQLTGPVSEGGWSIKDHLAHIAEWQRRGLAVINGKHPAVGLGIELGEFEQLADVHAINEVLFRRNRDRPLGEVIEDFRETHRTIEARIEAMSDRDLHQELTGPVASRFRRVIDLANFNFARHDRVHISDIRTLAEFSE